MSMFTVVLVITLVLGSFAEEKLPRSLNEPRDDQGYAEQCRVTNLWKVQLGYVNVIAFLDPSWHYSYRQAIMLELLKKRLEKSDFTSVLFFVVTPSASLPENGVENGVEARTWKDISKNMLEQEYFWGTEESQFYKLTKNNEKGLIFVRDTPDLNIMNHFRASRDEVVVLDRCGKLTYHVIIPWSILYFPYVKAAILSTYKENPCGPCTKQEQPLPMYNSIEYEEYLFEDNSNSKGTEKSLDLYKEETPSDLESKNITTFSKKTKENENYEDTSTPHSIDANLTTNDTYTSDFVLTDIPPLKTDQIGSIISTENILLDTNNTKDNNSLINDKIASTTEISIEPTQTEILSTLSDIKITEDYKEARDNNLLFTIINAPNDEKKDYNEYENIKKDHEQQTVNTESIKSQVTEKTEDLPLRIILYLPHTHEENQTLKQYTHLILKTGNSNYHDHFHSINGIYNQEKPIASENLDSTIAENKKLGGFANGINESPGIYGEVTYYWRTAEDDEFSNQDDNIEFLEFDDSTMEDAETKSDDTFDNESEVLIQSSGADATDANTNNKINEDSEEIMQRRLIEHYNKLVPWIHYIL